MGQRLRANQRESDKNTGGGVGVFLEIHILLGGENGEINTWPQGMVEINIFYTKEI